MAPYPKGAATRTITCRKVAEGTSAYLEGHVQHFARDRIDAHLASCVGCRAYVDQIELVTKTLKLLPGPIIGSAQRDRLRERFLASADAAWITGESIRVSGGKR